MSQSCGKTKFSTRDDALQFHDRRWPGTYRRAYRCDRCGRWHLTTTPIGQTSVGKRAVVGPMTLPRGTGGCKMARGP